MQLGVIPLCSVTGSSVLGSCTGWMSIMCSQLILGPQTNSQAILLGHGALVVNMLMNCLHLPHNISVNPIGLETCWKPHCVQRGPVAECNAALKPFSRSCTAADVYTTGWRFIPSNPLRPRQNGRHFTDDRFKCIFLNENFCILIKISLKFVPKIPINNNPALVQIMALRRIGDKTLS